ncbi:MAG: hypothetical protein AVDCRST_MAG38-2592, partial [uncultured Solirubrobacteraceae bacterium]
VGERDDAALELRFGSAVAQRLLLTAMLLGARRHRAAGLRADVGLVLTAASVPERGWTLRIDDGALALAEGAPAAAALTLHLPLPTFARLLAGRAQLSELATHPAVGADGDLTLLQRLGEVLGAPSPY